MYEKYEKYNHKGQETRNFLADEAISGDFDTKKPAPATERVRETRHDAKIRA